MSSYAKIKSQLNEMEKKLEETMELTRSDRSPLSDALRVVIPMMQDQVAIMRELLDHASPGTY